MARDREDRRVKSVFREIVTILDKEVGDEPFRFSESEKDRGNHFHETIALLSIPEHVSVFSHSDIVTVHSYLCPELRTQICAVARMVEITVGQDDEVKIPGLAAGALQFILELSAPLCGTRVDQDKACGRLNEVAVHTTHTVRKQ